MRKSVELIIPVELNAMCICENTFVNMCVNSIYYTPNNPTDSPFISLMRVTNRDNKTFWRNANGLPVITSNPVPPPPRPNIETCYNLPYNEILNYDEELRFKFEYIDINGSGVFNFSFRLGYCDQNTNGINNYSYVGSIYITKTGNELLIEPTIIPGIYNF